MGDAENSLEKDIADAVALLQGTEKEIKEVEAKAENTAVEEQTPPETKEEEDQIPHGERSRLGRKVKRLEDTLSEIKSSLDFLKEKTVPQQVQIQEEEPELPEGATSEEIKEFVKKDRERLLRELETRESQKSKGQTEKRQKYIKEYTRMVEDMLDPEEDADIYKLMTDTKDLTFNQVHSGFEDAKNDFLINYRAATKSVLNKTKPVTKTTVANKKTGIPTGVNVPGGTKPSVKKVDISKWSAEEQELARHFSDEELAAMGI